MKNILISILMLLLVSCAIQQRPDVTSKVTEKKPRNSDYILGAWSCNDQFQAGELDLEFKYIERYMRDGKYELEGVLTAYFRVENLRHEYLLRSHGVWYFSGKKQINYKIESYSVTDRKNTLAAEALNFVSLIPKSRSYNSLLVSLDEKQFRSQIHPFTMGETRCVR